MTRRRFFLIAAIIGLFAHDGHAQVHMSAGTVPFTDTRGIAWTPNTCTGWKPFPNIGAYSHPIYNATAYTAAAGVPIVCAFTVPDGGLYRILIHLIEAVRTFNAPQRRVFDIWINGDPALGNIDTFTRAGAVEAPVDVAAITNAPDGTITVSFLQQSPPRSSAMFAGIEVLPLASAPPLADLPITCPASSIPEGIMAFAMPLQSAMRLTCVIFDPSTFVAQMPASPGVPPVLRVMAPASMGRVDLEVLTADDTGAYILSHASYLESSLYVYADKTLQFKGADYGLDGQKVVFVDPQPTGTVRASYLFQPQP